MATGLGLNRLFRGAAGGIGGVSMAKQGSGRQGGRTETEQGDVNTTPARQRYWERNLSGKARGWFEEDARYFLHQSLSTPVLNVIARAQGISIEDLAGRKYIDMHGNGVHNFIAT